MRAECFQEVRQERRWLEGNEPKHFESTLREDRVFPAASGVRSSCAHQVTRTQYDAMYRRSIEDGEAFWREAAERELDWMAPFTSRAGVEMSL